MSQADLRQIVIDKAIANNYIEDYEDIDQANPKLWSIINMLLDEDLIVDVQNDWAKIDFSTENLDVTAEKTTPDGVPYFQIRTGGDWETPLIAIIYFDGKKLRGYVPKNGNTYNHKTKAAFGNNDSDNDACIAQFGNRGGTDEEYRDVEPDITLIEADIANRIQAKGTYSYSRKPVMSKAKIEAAAQAEIEKGQDLSGPLTANKVYAVIELAAGGSYFSFKLRSSKRKLKPEESDRVVGIPAIFEKKTVAGNVIWYSPRDMYPLETLKVLESAGFKKAPDNDLSIYEGARTHVIYL
jgi:hypothetical protein